LDAILQLSQFEKVVTTRKNAKHIVLKEEERVVNILEEMKEDGRIDEHLFSKIRPMGSQPPRLYGLAKVHKNDVPVRPVLSMPGSAYHRVGEQVAEWLAKVPECGINSSTKEICDRVRNVKLEEDEELVSFDVKSLYTFVPVLEAILICADLLFRDGSTKPPVDKDTFVELAKIAACNVVMSTHDGYYRQIEGLAMGSPPAPHLANGWMSTFDKTIEGDAKLFTRYMDDILRDIKRSEIDQKLAEINNLHPNLLFTIERELDGMLPFLDMRLIHEGGHIASTWYAKPTDTGLILNFHALAPKRYKRSVVSGFVHRIHRACSSWSLFHESMQKARKILERNQYPPCFYDPIINQTLSEIIAKSVQANEPAAEERNTQTTVADISSPLVETPKKAIFLQYRGKCTEDYARSLHKCKAPCTIIMTLRKLKTTMPSLKPPVEKHLRSGVVYMIVCASCQAAYVGQTCRHLLTRVKEHKKPSTAMGKHMRKCQTEYSLETTSILASSSRGMTHLMTLEALYIAELKPTLNTKEEYRSRELTIKFF
jgi:hypothetical protein